MYTLFPLYMVSAPACPVTLTSVESDSIWPRPALKTLEPPSCDRRMFRNMFQHVLIYLHHG